MRQYFCTRGNSPFRRRGAGQHVDTQSSWRTSAGSVTCCASGDSLTSSESTFSTSARDAGSFQYAAKSARDNAPVVFCRLTLMTSTGCAGPSAVATSRTENDGGGTRSPSPTMAGTLMGALKPWRATWEGRGDVKHRQQQHTTRQKKCVCVCVIAHPFQCQVTAIQPLYIEVWNVFCRQKVPVLTGGCSEQTTVRP